MRYVLLAAIISTVCISSSALAEAEMDLEQITNLDGRSDATDTDGAVGPLSGEGVETEEASAETRSKKIKPGIYCHYVGLIQASGGGWQPCAAVRPGKNYPNEIEIDHFGPVFAPYNSSRRWKTKLNCRTPPANRAGFLECATRQSFFNIVYTFIAPDAMIYHEYSPHGNIWKAYALPRVMTLNMKPLPVDLEVFKPYRRY